jgi:Na+-transporting methylmalonyl-CoA/oxaloacetate decarboxylase gamma subunit
MDVLKTDSDFSNLSKLRGKELSKEIANSLEEIWKIVRNETGLLEPRLSVKIARIQFLISQEAKEQTKRIVSLTRWLLGLTFVLAFLTLLLFMNEAGLFPKNAYHSDSRPDSAYAIKEQKNKQSLNIEQPSNRNSKDNSSYQK